MHCVVPWFGHWKTSGWSYLLEHLRITLVTMQLARIDIRHLRYFVAMAQVGAVTKAAYALRVSPPSFGRQIRDLENRLGVPLFDRSDRKCELSSCGRYFALKAQELIAEWDKMFEALESDWSRANPRPMIAAPDYIAASDILPKCLYPRFQLSAPEITVPAVSEYDREPKLSDILEGHADFVLTLTAPTDRDMSYTKIDEGPVVAMFPESHPLSECDEINVADLDENLMRVSMDPARFPQLARMDATVCRESGRIPTKRTRVSRIKTALEMVNRGESYAISHGLAYSSILDRAIATRPIKDCEVQPVYLVWRKDAEDEASAAVVEALSGETRQRRRKKNSAPCLQSN